MSPRLRHAILLALAACAPGAAIAADPPPALTPTPNSKPAPPPLVPLEIVTPPAPPAEAPPTTAITFAPELAPTPAEEAAIVPIPPAYTAAPPPVRPTMALTPGDELFKRLRGKLNPGSCRAGNNSARWRERYAGHPTAFARRIQTVLPLIDFVSVELERAGLPAEFTFIPLVESWYQPAAIGPGGPAGMWQMIATTAKNHGIHIREGYDGRLSPVESTRAALSYLKVLQDMFPGDWQAMVMAYNAGEGRMQNAMRRARSRVTSAADRRPHGLSNITYDYVDKLNALSCLVLQPHMFNLRLPVDTRYEPLVPLLMDPGVDSLEEFARIRGKDAAELRRLNPGFRNGRVVDGVPRLVLAPPGAPMAPPPTEVAAVEAPDAQMLALADDEQASIAELLDSALSADQAAFEAVSVADAQVAAPLDSATALAPAAPTPIQAPQAMTVSDTSPAGEAPLSVHEVRQGESLWSIAQHYHVQVDQLRRANKLDAKATVHPGQVLQLVP